MGRADRKGAPDTFDVDGYVALLNRLRRPGDAPIYAPVLNRGIEEPIGSAVSVPADVPLVITEGNYLLLDDHGWGAVRDCLDEVWFLAVDSAVRERRLVLRRQLFGHSAAEAHSSVANRGLRIRHPLSSSGPARSGCSCWPPLVTPEPAASS